MLPREYGAYVGRPSHLDTCTGLPSSCGCAPDITSLWMLTKDSDLPISDPGKWMVFPPTPRDADRAWMLVRAATAAGHLGFAAKVSFQSRVKPAILVFCSGTSPDRDTVRQRLFELVEGLWPSLRLVWKSDIQTYVEPTYSPGYAVLQRTPGSSGLFTWYQAARVLLDVERAHLLPPEHPHGSPAGTVAALVGDSLLKLEVLRALHADDLEVYAARQSDPVELTTQSAFAVSNELLSREAVTILLDGLAHTAFLSPADLDGLSEHGRASVVEAAVYHVHRLLTRRGKHAPPAASAAASTGDDASSPGPLPTAHAALEDLAQHLVAAARGTIDWHGLLLRTGGSIDIRGDGPQFVAVASLRSMAVEGAAAPSKAKAATVAARDLLTRLGFPLVPAAVVHGFDALAGRAGKLRAQCDGGGPVDFRGALEQLGGELTAPATQTPGSSLQRPRFVASASIAGVTRTGAHAITAAKANGAAAAAVLCATGLISPHHATLAFLAAGGGSGTPATSDSSAAPAAGSLPRELHFGGRRVDTAKYRVEGGHSAYDFKGLLLGLGGMVHKATPVAGAAAHEPAYEARATLGPHEAQSPPQPSIKRAEAAAAEALLRAAFDDQ